MLNGIKFLAEPLSFQRKTFSEWMGCNRFIWNAKCEEDKYLRKVAKRYLPVGIFPKPDQKYSQYKNDILSPWLKNCPSQILRNSASNWYSTYQNFLKGLCGRPKKKRRDRGGSILLTRELFRFDVDENTKQIKLFIGTKKNNIGYLKVKWHDKKWLKEGYPNSIRIKKTYYGRYTVSFCYDTDEKQVKDRQTWFDELRELEAKELNEIVLGVDRGINVICATDDDRRLNATTEEEKNIEVCEIKKKRYQRKLAKRKKGSKRRKKMKKKLSKVHAKKKNIRENICHRISKNLVESEGKKVIVFENLQTKNMTRSAKGNKENPGKNVGQKKGLNKDILNKAWHKIEIFTTYKAFRKGKVVYKIDPKYTSQECACCGRIHPQNRNGEKFKCIFCYHKDHADNSAGKILKKRTVKLLLHSGTELSENGTLKNKLLFSDIGRGAEIRPYSRTSKKALA